MTIRTVIATSTAAALALSSATAHAFCGFYVAGSDKKMFNDATEVVLIREGTRTVLAMQNDYRGPLEDFAMVIPVPVVLKPTDVRVVDPAVLARLDSLGSPRLVEYWEQDPCPVPIVYGNERYYKPKRDQMLRKAPMATPSAGMGRAGGDYALKPEPPSRPAVPPILASFAANPVSITADTPTQVTWSFAYSNEPYPTPTCTVDNSVGRVGPGMQTQVKLQDSTTFTLTCANSAGKSQKQARINVVKIEAKFDVAEYQILILSAKEATGLEDWLKLNGYKVPADAAPLLRPYIESGSKFFVAKIDPKKVKEVDGHVALSPLRFHYDTEEFSLPVRLGLANSSGKQDLIINIISDKRYEVANYKNVVIPTNFDVRPAVKTRFAEFYAALFDKSIEATPRSVVTEYAWEATPSGKCDPCPPQVPVDADIMQLGGDVAGGRLGQGYYVLTRLHARYGKADLKDDLRFKEAPPITGGREQWGPQGIEYGAKPASNNNFQARYAIRYPWTGPIKCSNPRRNVWGGPPPGTGNQIIAANKVAFAPRGKLELRSVIKRDLWEIGYKIQPTAPAPAPKPTPPPTTKTQGILFFGGGGLGGLILVGLGLYVSSLRKKAKKRS